MDAETDLELDDTVSVSDARSMLSDLLNRAAYSQSKIGIERYGKVVAVLISPEDAMRLQRLADAVEARRDSGEQITLRELLERLGLDLGSPVDPELLGI